MRYEVFIVETLMKKIECDADSLLKAKEKVWNDYKECYIVLGSEDHISTEIY